MKKIMFNDHYGLTKAVLEGRKTQTRRIIPESWLEGVAEFQEEYFNDTLDHIEGKELLEQYFLIEQRRKPHFAVGETLAVAQCLKDLGYDANDRSGGAVWGLDHTAAWANKMFISASQCRNHIRITDIRIQRLQDISDEDCLKEGIWKATNIGLEGETYWYTSKINSTFRTPKDAYAELIDKVSGKGTWERNPWVFVYDFEFVK